MTVRSEVAAGKRTARNLIRLWRRTDPGAISASWLRQLAEAIGILTAAQVKAAEVGARYVGAGDEVDPEAFAGVASDGRELKGLLFSPALLALGMIRQGVKPKQAMASAALSLEVIGRTQVADASRAATGAGIVARTELKGYVRMLVGDTCSRCIILAGRVYRWNEGFLRHPACDCRHIPYAESVPEDRMVNPKQYFDGLTAAEQDSTFGKAGAQAIRDGADIGQVVNARKGMQTAAGRLVTTTSAGRRPRLMPEQIYREAGDDRAEAIRLLRLHRYLR